MSDICEEGDSVGCELLHFLCHFGKLALLLAYLLVAQLQFHILLTQFMCMHFNKGFLFGNLFNTVVDSFLEFVALPGKVFYSPFIYRQDAADDGNRDNKDKPPSLIKIGHNFDFKN